MAQGRRGEGDVVGGRWLQKKNGHDGLLTFARHNHLIMNGLQKHSFYLLKAVLLPPDIYAFTLQYLCFCKVMSFRLSQKLQANTFYSLQQWGLSTELCHERCDEGGCLFEVFTVDVIECGELGAVDVYLAYYGVAGE